MIEIEWVAKAPIPIAEMASPHSRHSMSVSSVWMIVSLAQGCFSHEPMTFAFRMDHAEAILEHEAIRCTNAPARLCSAWADS